jgi:hypothetical protein
MDGLSVKTQFYKCFHYLLKPFPKKEISHFISLLSEFDIFNQLVASNYEINVFARREN